MIFFRDKSSFFRKILFAINIFNSFFIAICFVLNNYYHPIFSVFSFFTFLYPLFFFINICFFIYWSLKIDFRFFLSFSILIFMFYNSVSFFKIGERTVEEKEDFHVMSFNSRLFNHYRWIDQDSIPSQIKKFIINKMPDVLSIQEYHGAYKDLLSGYKNKYIYLSSNNVGQSIFTNNQIINRGAIEFDNSNNSIIFIDIVEKKDTIRVYNAHFESFKVDVKKIRADVKSFKNVVGKIKNGYVDQKQQLDTLLSHVSRSSYKTILTVDLNNTEHSFVYKEIANKMDDIFKLKGKGFGSTYAFKFMPIRIDYIFVSPSITAKNFTVHDKNISDHKPISAFIKI